MLQRILSAVDDAAHCTFTAGCNASHYIHHIPTGLSFCLDVIRVYVYTLATFHVIESV